MAKARRSLGEDGCYFLPKFGGGFWSVFY